MNRIQLLADTEDIGKYFLHVVDDEGRYMKVLMFLHHEKTGFTVVENVLEIYFEESFSEA